MTTTRELLPVSETAIKAQIGLIRNNRARKRNGEAPVASKNWKLAGLSRAALRSILAGETVDRDFKSGRNVTLTLG